VLLLVCDDRRISKSSLLGFTLCNFHTTSTKNDKNAAISVCADDKKNQRWISYSILSTHTISNSESLLVPLLQKLGINLHDNKYAAELGYTSRRGIFCECFPNLGMYRGADKSLARPGRKQAKETEDFEFHISYL
jgi:hypothetical protein